MAERLHFHFPLSCIEEGNGNPLQCSCLENLRDGEAWWAAVYGVTQSRTRLKRRSSSSSSSKQDRSPTNTNPGNCVPNVIREEPCALLLLIGKNGLGNRNNCRFADSHPCQMGHQFTETYAAAVFL